MDVNRKQDETRYINHSSTKSKKNGKKGEKHKKNMKKQGGEKRKYKKYGNKILTRFREMLKTETSL